MPKLYPQDIILPGLIKSLGGAVRLKIPDNLTADDLARIANYLSVPGLTSRLIRFPDNKYNTVCIELNGTEEWKIIDYTNSPTPEGSQEYWYYSQYNNDPENFNMENIKPTKEKAIEEGKKELEYPFYVMQLNKIPMGPVLPDVDQYVDSFADASCIELPESTEDKILAITEEQKQALERKIQPLQEQLSEVMEDWLEEIVGPVFEVYQTICITDPFDNGEEE